MSQSFEIERFEYREIGESDWMECDIEWFEYCSQSPEHDSRIIYKQS